MRMITLMGTAAAALTAAMVFAAPANAEPASLTKWLA